MFGSRRKKEPKKTLRGRALTRIATLFDSASFITTVSIFGALSSFIIGPLSIIIITFMLVETYKKTAIGNKYGVYIFFIGFIKMIPGLSALPLWTIFIWFVNRSERH